jgi:hypothetical protein
MDTVGRHVTLTVWMLALLAIIIFVMSARIGILHDAAWSDACDALAQGEPVRDATTWDAIQNCSNPRRPS